VTGAEHFYSGQFFEVSLVPQKRKKEVSLTSSLQKLTLYAAHNSEGIKFYSLKQ
jgi:hypothetical protein